MVLFPEYFLDFFFLCLGERVNQAECMVKGALGPFCKARCGRGEWYSTDSNIGLRQRDRTPTRQIVMGELDAQQRNTGGSEKCYGCGVALFIIHTYLTYDTFFLITN
jgi:hypothetical protein